MKRPKVSAVSAVGKKASVVKKLEPGAARKPAVKAVVAKATTSRVKPAMKAVTARPATIPATARSKATTTTTTTTTDKAANGKPKPKRNAWDLKGRLQVRGGWDERIRGLRRFRYFIRRGG